MEQLINHYSAKTSSRSASQLAGQTLLHAGLFGGGLFGTGGEQMSSHHRRGIAVAGGAALGVSALFSGAGIVGLQYGPESLETTSLIALGLGGLALFVATQILGVSIDGRRPKDLD